MKIDEIPLRYRGAVMDQIAAVDRRDSRTAEPIAPVARRESILQNEAEKWLDWIGYWRRTATNIASGPPPRGWQIHLANAPRNPLVLDLLILDNSGEWIEVELKGPTTRVAAHQKQLIEQNSRRFLCRSVDQLRTIVSQLASP
tara:strand:- start:497 stop:925 length:429 start_codon:yes stop_codon:yes gene_type:complete